METGLAVLDCHWVGVVERHRQWNAEGLCELVDDCSSLDLGGYTLDLVQHQ